MSFKSTVQDAGETNVECDGEWEHDPITLVINPDFLIKTAAAMSGENILLEVDGVSIPTVLREKGDEQVESFCVFAVARK